MKYISAAAHDERGEADREKRNLEHQEIFEVYGIRFRFASWEVEAKTMPVQFTSNDGLVTQILCCGIVDLVDVRTDGRGLGC